MQHVKSGAIFNGHRKSLGRGSDAGLAAADPRMLAERNILAELRLGSLQICLYDSLVLTVDQNRLPLNPEQIRKSLIVVHEHIPGGRAHKDFDATELCAVAFGKIFPDHRRVVVCGPDVESVVCPRAFAGPVQLVLKSLQVGCRRLRVRHIDKGCDPAEQGSL